MNAAFRRHCQSVLAFACWVLLLTLALAYPSATDSPTLGDDLTRCTVRVALLYWALATTLFLVTNRTEWHAGHSGFNLARLCWTLAWLAYLVHLAMAFHFYHHWSHANAAAHTEEVSGFGPGIWFSHLFTIVWTADVVAWWARPSAYARRSAWFGWTLHGYLAFINFNSTVVYGTGFIRYAGLAMFAWLLGVCLWRNGRRPHGDGGPFSPHKNR